MRSFKSNENIHKKEGGSYYIKVSVNVLEIGVFTACNNVIYLCAKRKLKGSKNTGSGTIFRKDFGDKI